MLHRTVLNAELKSMTMKTAINIIPEKLPMEARSLYVSVHQWMVVQFAVRPRAHTYTRGEVDSGLSEVEANTQNTKR